jgi:hypothetical protein
MSEGQDTIEDKKIDNLELTKKQKFIKEAKFF